MAVVRMIALCFIRAYQKWISPGLPKGICNLEPSCSHYGYAAIEQHGFLHGIHLILVRLQKCGKTPKLTPRVSDPVPLRKA